MVHPNAKASADHKQRSHTGHIICMNAHVMSRNKNVAPVFAILASHIK